MLDLQTGQHDVLILSINFQGFYASDFKANGSKTASPSRVFFRCKKASLALARTTTRAESTTAMLREAKTVPLEHKIVLDFPSHQFIGAPELDRSKAVEPRSSK